MFRLPVVADVPPASDCLIDVVDASSYRAQLSRNEWIAMGILEGAHTIPHSIAGTHSFKNIGKSKAKVGSKVSQRTSLIKAIHATGKTTTELGDFFGWESKCNTKSASDFTREQIENFGLTKEMVEGLAKGYYETAMVPGTRANMSANLRAIQLREIILQHFK